MSRLRGLTAAVAIVVSVATVARGDDKKVPLEKVKEQLIEANNFAACGCAVKARAALAAIERSVAQLGEFEVEQVQSDVASLKARLDEMKKRQTPEVVSHFERVFDSLAREIEESKSRDPGDEDDHFVKSVADARDMLADEDNQALVGKDVIAKFERKLVWIQQEVTKNALGSWLSRIEDLAGRIRAVVEGKDDRTYADTVEKWFKQASAILAKCPSDEAKSKNLRAELKKLRVSFTKVMETAQQAEVIDPAVNYWKACKTDYGSEAAGWEKETKPRSLKEFINNAPPELGCPKTQLFLREVIVRWFDNDNTKAAIEKFPDSAALKPVIDEASRLREEAGNKVCAFANTILDEADKLPPGKERGEFQSLLGEMARLVSQETKGSTACERTLLRVSALEKRWIDAKEKGEAERAAREKLLTDAANAAWPDLVAAVAAKAKAKTLDPSAALADIDAWKGTFVHFTGGARGVNLNRSGWNYQDQYDFIVEKNGVPVCGNFDDGLAEALKGFTKATGVAPDNCEECVGVVEGACRVWERVQNPLDKERYMRGRQLEAVRIRIVAWKACTVSACVGKGTSLAKATGFTDVPVAETGTTR